MSDCPFCAIIAGKAWVELVDTWPNVWAITPLNPVVPGHVLFIPTVHVKDFTEDPAISSSVMFRAAQYAQGRGDCNLLTSLGVNASQSVFHLHLHYVPRRPNDGLELPWPQHADGREGAAFALADGATGKGGPLSPAPVPADPSVLLPRSASVPPTDLMAALQASFQEAKAARDFLTAPFPGHRTGSSAAGSAPPG